MVEFTLKDYEVLLRWFELLFAKNTSKLKFEDRRVFWKLNFFIEDRIEEERLFGKEKD